MDNGDGADNHPTGSTAVRIAQINDAIVRIVVHKNITDEDVDIAIEKIIYVIGKLGSR